MLPSIQTFLVKNLEQLGQVAKEAVKAEAKGERAVAAPVSHDASVKSEAKLGSHTLSVASGRATCAACAPKRR